MKIDKPRPTLPDSTTTFLTSSREMEDAASAEAAQAVASLQVSTDLEFNDLFNVTSCSSAESVASEPSFTLIDTFTTDSKITPLKSADFTMLQSSSTNPTLGTASEVMVTSTTLDQPMLEINGSKNAVVSSIVNNDIYTLTLTDGSIVQLRVTNEQPNQLSQLQVVDQNQQNWQQHDRVSPDSFAAEVTVPFDKSSDLMSPTSPVPPAVSPTEVFPAMIPSKRRQTRKSKASYTRSSSVCSEDSKDYYSAASAASEDSDNEDFFNMFSNSMEKVTIESLKAKLSALPEGQTDLGALLVAAKIDLTVEQIVGPPLTTVKKIMEHKGLSEWQMTLCLKIRRRKKNTAAVRSSRRKRNQYVVDLRDLVTDLKRRKSEAFTQNDLLKKLIGLWERLCSEVESEIQDGVRQQLNLTIPDLDHNSISIPSEEEINSRLLSIRDAAKFATCNVNHPSDELMTNLFSNTDAVLQFDTSDADRGAMEL